MPGFLQRQTAICTMLPTVLRLYLGIFHTHLALLAPAGGYWYLNISLITTLTVNVIHLLPVDSSFPHLMIPPALGRRLSLPVVGRGNLSITGIAHFATMSLLIMVTVDRQPL